ncbi:UPF0134 protein [Amphibalanus amphitrite]|uniref:UPF0134 protein n=1 Tax=Amphibalanus amphitrite TaxID=1232801 RepID=A0A6A4WRI3_AMPAM|nr:UPF0134 protein [Amphibalanus amphitrite]
MALKRSEALGTAGRFAFHDRGDRDDSGALVTSAINRRRGRRRALAIVFRDEPEIIGCDGGPGSDDEDPVVDGDDDELAEPSEVLTAEERAFLNLTKRNTDFNSITSNLSGTSRTLLDWVDENDRTTERSALTGRHKKFTPVVCVAPFSTGRGPGPLKINPVAPMQNGEVVSTGRIQEMVEKRSVIDQATKREQQVTRLDDKVTRLDDKVTRLDDKVDKITRLDDKDAKITRLDDTIEKPDEKVTKVDDKITKIDDKSIENYEKLKSSEINAADDKPVAKKSSSPPAKIKAVSATGTADVKSTTDTGSKSVSEGISQLKAGPGSRVPETGNAEPAKSAQRWSGGADRSGSAAVESGGGGEQPAPADPPMSNIDLIKARLAEKAAQNGPSSWRRPGNHPERNRARLNSLDGVPKSPKLRSHRAPGEGGSAVGGASDTGRTRSPPRAAEPPSAAESRTAACDRVTEPPTPAVASGPGVVCHAQGLTSRLSKCQPSLRNSHGSGLYAQIQQADQRRASRDAGPPPRPSPPSEPRSEPVQAEPATSQTPSVSTDDEEDELPAPPQRTVSRSRARFSLKKFLKFGRDEKRKERDLVYGEFRAKPEIIHPIDRAGVGCVQVIGRPSEQRRREQAEYRQRRERPSQDTATTQDTSPTTVNPPSTPPRLPERQSHPAHPTHPTHPTHHGQHSHGGHRASTGLTPEGRPKPPPPPPPSCRQSGDPMTPPTRPPPPNPHLFSRSRDGWARAPDSDYANLGVSRAGLTPKKPGRGSRSRERSEGSASADHQPPALQADQVGLRRQQPCRLSLREAPACGPPASLLDSYDAVTAANREALQQLCEKMSGAVPAPLLPLQAAPLSLRDFQVSPQSQLPLGRHLFVEAVCGGEPVALCLTEGPMAAAPLSVPSVTDFTDTVPARLLADPHGPDGSQRIGTVHVIPAARVRPLSALLDAQPAEAPHSATLLLLQTVRQLQLLPAVDEQLSQLVALTVDRLQPPRLAAVLSAPPPPPGAGLSPCVAALSVLLRLLGVPAAVQRARDGRGVSSVPDGPQVTEHELLASLLQRDDDASLRRAAAVLGCLLWAPAGLAPAEAPRWLHRQRAELLGAAVRWDQPPAVDQLLRLCFLAETDPETVTDALELINI